MKQRARGFTLLELMIVVAVVAILAMIALPMFIEQLRKGKRTEAIQTISDFQLREEKWRAFNATYGTSASVLAPYTATTFSNTLKYYNVDIATNTATSYIVTATRKGQLANDPKCGDFKIYFGVDSGGTATPGVSNYDVTSGDKDYCWRKK